MSKRKHTEEFDTASTKKQKKDEEPCAICLEPPQEEECTLSCGHMFHSACIWPWLIENKTCPICRDGTVRCQHYREELHKDDPLWYITAHGDKVSKPIVESLLNEMKSLKKTVQELRDRQLAISFVNPIPILFHIMAERTR